MKVAINVKNQIDCLSLRIAHHNCGPQRPWDGNISNVLSEIAAEALQLRCHNGPQLWVILVFLHSWLCLSVMDDIKEDHYIKLPWDRVCFVLVVGHLTWVPLTGHSWIRNHLSLLFHLNNFSLLQYHILSCLLSFKEGNLYFLSLSSGWMEIAGKLFGIGSDFSAAASK